MPYYEFLPVAAGGGILPRKQTQPLVFSLDTIIRTFHVFPQLYRVILINGVQALSLPGLICCF